MICATIMHRMSCRHCRLDLIDTKRILKEKFTPLILWHTLQQTLIMASPRAHDPVFRINLFKDFYHRLFISKIKMDWRPYLPAIKRVGDFIFELNQISSADVFGATQFCSSLRCIFTSSILLIFSNAFEPNLLRTFS